MKKLVPALAALTLFAAPAFAQSPLSFADVDSDGSGELSFAELQAVWPDLTQDEFNAVDLDANGGLNAEELNALQPATLQAPGAAPMDPAMTAPTPMDDAAPAAPTTDDGSLLETDD